MRLFTAIELGDEVRAQAASLIRELRARAGELAPRARLTWAVPEKLHLTLRFIGEVDGDQAGRIIGVMRDPVPVAPFTVEWEGLGAFPKHGPPRVLWVGVGAGRDDLVEAEREISARLATIGIVPEQRPYNPHLTLARVRDAAGLRAARIFEGLNGGIGSSEAVAITLFRSHPSPKGSTYEVLQKTPLSRI